MRDCKDIKVEGLVILLNKCGGEKSGTCYFYLSCSTLTDYQGVIANSHSRVGMDQIE